MQEREHAKELQGIQRVKAWAERNCIPFQDVHEDFETGVDIYLGYKPYDLKVAESGWLTLVKEYKGEWYSPLQRHPEIPYLVLKGNWGFVVDKKKLQSHCFRMSNKSGIELGVYTLDGNINITFNAEKFLQYPDFVFTN